MSLRRPTASDSFGRDALPKARAFASSAALWAIVASAVYFSSAHTALEDAVATPMAQAWRDLGAPRVSFAPQLKIFAYDDEAVLALQSESPPVADWARVFGALAAQAPASVIVDESFAFLPVESDAARAAVSELAAAAKKLPNLTVAALVDEQVAPGRAALMMDREDLRLDPRAKLSTRPLEVYGPHPSLRDAFAHIAHFRVARGGRIEPWLRIAEGRALPHASVFAVRRGRDLQAPLLPLDRRNMLSFELPSRQAFKQHTRSFLGAILAARAGRPIPGVEAGDTVLILTHFFAGARTEVETARGKMPTGAVLASAIDSVLRAQFLTPVPDASGSVLLFIVLAVAGAAAGAYLVPLTALPLILLSTTALAALGIFATARLGAVVPWIPAAAATAGAGLHAAYTLASCRERINRRVREALKGAVPEARLEKILRSGASLAIAPSERVVTVMFVDIANFSIAAERAPPQETFLHLRQVLRDATRTVHKYGGTVDKTLGDGMLCFFGYSYDGEVIENQADQAMRCAVEMQRENVRRCVDAARAGKPMLAFRIGLNTGAVYIGDIGTDERLDFTVIGNGVNYAKRLEAACDLNHIMLSPTTLDFATSFAVDQPGFKKRLIHVKHQKDLIEAIELDPIHDEPELAEAARAEFRRAFNLDRKDQRWPVLEPSRFRILSEFGKVLLVDFSFTGACVRLGSYLSKGVMFDLELGQGQPELAAKLEAKGLTPLRCEVRWGRPESEEEGVSGAFLHGLKYVNLSELQMKALLDILRDSFAAGSGGAPKLKGAG